MMYCKPLRLLFIGQIISLFFLCIPAVQANPTVTPEITVNRIIDRAVKDTPFKLITKDAPFYRENTYRYDIDGKRGEPTIMVSHIELMPSAKENHQDSREQLQLSLSHGAGALQVLLNGKALLGSRAPDAQPIEHVDYQLNHFAFDIPVEVNQGDELIVRFTPKDDRSNVYLSFTYASSGMASNRVKLVAPEGEGAAHYLVQTTRGKFQYKLRSDTTEIFLSTPDIKQEFDIPERLDFSDWRYFSGTMIDAIHQANQHFDTIDYHSYVKQHTE